MATKYVRAFYLHTYYTACDFTTKQYNYCIAGTFMKSDFCDPRPECENKNRKIRTAKTCELLLELLREHLNSWKFVVCTSLAQSDDGAVLLFQTCRRHPTLSHRRSFVLYYPGDNKGAWAIAHAKREN